MPCALLLKLSHLVANCCDLLQSSLHWFILHILCTWHICTSHYSCTCIHIVMNFPLILYILTKCFITLIHCWCHLLFGYFKLIVVLCHYYQNPISLNVCFCSHISKEVDQHEEDDQGMLVPKLKIGADGNIIIDEARWAICFMPLCRSYIRVKLCRM